MDENNRPLPLISKTYTMLLNQFNETSKSFETKPISISLMAVGFLFFALTYVVNFSSGFIDGIRPFETAEYIASLICAMVLLLIGAGLRVYAWRIVLIENAKLTESTVKILKDNVESQKEVQGKTLEII